MIERLSKNQNWARLTPWLGVLTLAALFWQLSPLDARFWALLNIPLYLFHQCEEHYWPGGFKDYMNQKIHGLPNGEEKLTDTAVFRINILMVWVAFAVFGALTFVRLGFGLLIIVFSLINCLTHIAQGVRRKEWNPGLVMASIQFALSVYAAFFVTVHGLEHPVGWWAGAVAFSGLAHAALFRFMLRKE
jgi:hypothetical protein